MMKEIYYEQFAVPIAVSARHIHLNNATVEALFGSGYKLTINEKRSKMDMGLYVYEETLAMSGPRGDFPRVSILGPLRPYVQAEISLTDCRTLGLRAPMRDSGDVAGSSPVILRGPKGTLELYEGLVTVRRHIHIPPETASIFGVHDKELLDVAVNGPRGLVFSQTLIRVVPDVGLEMHIDTDEANAAMIPNSGTTGLLRVPKKC